MDSTGLRTWLEGYDLKIRPPESLYMLLRYIILTLSTYSPLDKPVKAYFRPVLTKMILKLGHHFGSTGLGTWLEGYDLKFRPPEAS